MERIETLKQYRSLINAVRQICRRPFSNNYFAYDDIERFIRLGRAYYHETAGGLIFLFDEERFFRACLHLDERAEFDLPFVNKRILVRTIYRKGREEAGQSSVEQRLNAIGFYKAGTTVQIVGDVEAIFNKCSRLQPYVEKMEKAGYRCMFAEGRQIDVFENLLLASRVIRDYHIDYKTPEEKRCMREAYLGIVDRNETLCAVSAVEIVRGTARGIGIAVVDRLKMHGLTSITAYHRYKWLFERGIKVIQGWVLVDNEPSIRYHTSLGYRMTDKFADEWIRE